MPHQVRTEWIALIAPAALLAALLVLELIAAKQLGHVTAWKAMRPLFVFGFTSLAVMLLFFVIQCAPFYLHGRVWSAETCHKIRILELGGVIVLLIWCLMAGKGWKEHALQVEEESKNRQQAEDRSSGI